MEPKLYKTRVKRKRYMKVQNIDTHHPTSVHINLEITLICLPTLTTVTEKFAAIVAGQLGFGRQSWDHESM